MSDTSLPELTSPVEVLQALIRCPSVTPDEAGTLDLIEAMLTSLGFTCSRRRFGEGGQVDNLYARYGSTSPHLCFAGHSDVVPAGDEARWMVDPFSGVIRDEHVYGRGAVDMKGGVACMIAAVARRFVDQKPLKGSISFLITGDEEGPALHGTKDLINALVFAGETFDGCILGEPTSVERIGDTIKIGRRGSLNGLLSLESTQGHVAYPHLADNVIRHVRQAMDLLTDMPLDEGNEQFQRSNLEITSVDVGNETSNIIPGSAQIRFNIRYNNQHDADSLDEALKSCLGGLECTWSLDTSSSGDAFLGGENTLGAIVADAVRQCTTQEAQFSTSGGTSDARFLHQHMPVVEIGLRSDTMHGINERTSIADLSTLTHIYGQAMELFWERNG